MQTVFVDAVLLKETRQVAVRVTPPAGIDLQFIYRAGLSCYWNPKAGLLEDRAKTVESAVTSAARIARALREELGIALQPSAQLRWEGIDDQTKDQLASALFGRLDNNPMTQST